jgi:PAS domain S-box-containing protein
MASQNLQRRNSARLPAWLSSTAVSMTGALLVVAIAAGVALFILNLREQITARDTATNAFIVRMLEDHATRTFNAVDLTISVTGDLIESRGQVPDATALNSALRGSPYIRSLSIVSGKGRVLASTNRENIGIELLASVVARFPTPGATSIGVPVGGRDLAGSGFVREGIVPGDRWFIPVIQRIATRAGEDRLIIAAVNPDFFANYYQVALDDDTSGAALMSYDGRLLVSTASIALAAGTDLKSNAIFFEHLLKRDSGTFIGRGLDGVESVVAYRVSRTLPLVLTVQSPRSRAKLEWIEVSRPVGIMGFVASAFILLLTWGAWRSLRSHEHVQAQLDEAFRDLESSEANYRSLVDSLHEAVFRTNPHGLITFASSVWGDLIGVAPEAALGRHLTEFFATADQGAVDGLLLEARDGKSDAPLQIRIENAKGEQRVLELIAYPLRGAEGELEGLAGLVTDVTARATAQRQLREQLRFARDLIAVNPSPIYVTDEQGAYLTINRAWEEFFGLVRQRVIGKRPGDVLAEADAQFLEHLCEAALRDGSVRAQGPVRRSDGAAREILFSLARYNREGGEAAGIVCSMTDVTELKEAEKQIRLAKEAAEAASRAKGEFLANMSHEIRTPMNGILGMTRLALGTELTREQREYLEIARSSGDALLAVVNDILDFSKIEAGKLTIERTRFDLHAVVADVTRLLAFQAHGKGLEMLVDIAPDVPRHVVGDPFRMRQILVNLLGNAVKFTAEGEVGIFIRATPAPGVPHLLEFAVRDTGQGIAAGKLAMIFEAFAQADTSTTRRYGGTGLGLAISSRLAQLMGGQIAVESVDGKGATFRLLVSLPPESVAATSAPLNAADRLYEGRNILVVDDHAGARQLIASKLARMGARVATAEGTASARRAIETARAGGVLPDWVFVDARLGKESGLELSRLIRQWLPNARRTLMLEMSTETAPPADAAEDVLRKPVMILSLETLVSGVGGGAVGADPPKAAVRSGARVLVVEDHPVNQMLIRRLLEKMGHAVELAGDGRAALEKLRGERFDLVLMDLQMPVMGGIEATQHIREAESTMGEHVPIVALTARAMEDDRMRCIEAGMDDYLSKPIEIDELKRVLQRFLGSEAPAAG